MKLGNYQQAVAHSDSGDCDSDKVDICHVTGSGSIKAKRVNANAVPAHLGHGDFLPLTFFADGDAATTVEACEAPAGFAADSTVCDDSNAAVNPGAGEVEGDGVDSDCNPDTSDVPPLTCVCDGDPNWADLISGADPIESCDEEVALSDFRVQYSGTSGFPAHFSYNPFTTEVKCLANPGRFLSDKELRDCWTVLDQAAVDSGVTCPWMRRGR